MNTIDVVMAGFLFLLLLAFIIFEFDSARREAELRKTEILDAIRKTKE